MLIVFLDYFIPNIYIIMFGIGSNKFYLVLSIVIALIVLIGFVIDYRIKYVVKNELDTRRKKKLLKLKKLKQNMLQNRQNIQEEQHDIDMDSYMDPTERYRQEHEDVADEQHNYVENNKRLTKDEMGMRDFL